MSTFALVDCNNFYASCERAFQPRLNGKPLVVLSNNDGCVIARSEEAKALGIGMGVPFHQVRDQLRRQGVAVFSSNYALYADMSLRVVAALRSFSPRVEVYSIDEAFLDFGGLGDPVIQARALRAMVRQWTGLPVSIGIAPTKTLAKAANRLAKREPDRGGVCALLTLADQAAALAGMKAVQVWGVGGRWAAKLEALGVRTALDLRDYNDRRIRQRFGVVLQRIVLELRGVSCLSLQDIVQPSRTIMTSRSFGRPTESAQDISEAASAFAARAAEKLRRQGLTAGGMSVFLHTSPYAPAQHHPSRFVRLPAPTADTVTLVGKARAAARDLMKAGIRYQKAGILLLDLVPADQAQGGLFQPVDERTGRLTAVMDRINHAQGSGAVRLAACGGPEPAWRGRSDFRSPRYTTRWEDIPEVR